MFTIQPESMDTAQADPKSAPPSKATLSNSHGRRDDAFRTRIGKKVDVDFRNQRAAKFSSHLPIDLSAPNFKTPIAFTSRPVTSVV